MLKLSPDIIVYYRESGMYYHLSSCDLLNYPDSTRPFCSTTFDKLSSRYLPCMCVKNATNYYGIKHDNSV